MELTYRQVMEAQNAMRSISELKTVGDLQLDLQMTEWMIELDKKVDIVQKKVRAYADELRAERKENTRRSKKETGPQQADDNPLADLTAEDQEKLRVYQEEKLFPNTCTVNLPPMDGIALRACETINLGQLAYLRPILTFGKGDGTKANNDSS